MITRGMMSSNTDEWSTPQDLFDELNDEFHFDLDVCATHENAKCKCYFTKEADGLSQEWRGTVFMNPPYGREIGKWIEKAAWYAFKNMSVVVAVLPARTDTKWFHTYIYGEAEIRFVKGRLKFGGCKNPAPFPSMIVIWDYSKNERYANWRNEE